MDAASPFTKKAVDKTLGEEGINGVYEYELNQDVRKTLNVQKTQVLTVDCVAYKRDLPTPKSTRVIFELRMNWCENTANSAILPTSNTGTLT